MRENYTHNFVLKGALIISITEHLLYITNEKMLAVGTVEEHSSGNSSTHTTIQYRRRAAKKCTSQRMRLRLQIFYVKQIIIDEYLFLCGVEMGSVFMRKHT